jgi:site-specific recombinase XerD
MKAFKKPNALACAMRDFFENHLPLICGMSPNTILSYRDCFVLLLRYVSVKKKCPVAKLDIEDLTMEIVISFLQMLEEKRHNCSKTRNIRLSAIHTFFGYLAGRCPEKLEQCQRILSIPFKRTRSHAMEYFEYDEIQAILAAIDRSREDGMRDYVLIATMFNTGARVQEILDLQIHHLLLVGQYQVRLIGKGRKERICPLWPQTAMLLKELIEKRSISCSSDHVFLNHRKEPLTRFGIRYILAKYCNLAKAKKPSLADKKLHPHSMRHSTAVYLLKSGVDIVTISHWLGHASLITTNQYISIDLEIKREAIRKASPLGTNSKKAPWLKNASILDWLESL